MTQAAVINIESESEEVHHLTTAGSLQGVVPILVAARNGPGVGRIKVINGQLSWKAPYSSRFGNPVECNADGTYILCDGEDEDKFIKIDVHTEYLPSEDFEAKIYLSEVYNNPVAQDDVIAVDAQTGVVLQYQLSVRNTSSITFSHIRIFLNPVADPRTELSLDGVNWYKPYTESEGLQIESLGSGQSITLNIKRTIAAGQSEKPKQRVHLIIGFDAI
jgi:hypothetical protein